MFFSFLLSRLYPPCPGLFSFSRYSGMATGILITVLLAATSWYTGYILVQFKVNHPGVMNFGDAGRIVAGRSGAIVMGGLLMVKVTLVAASHSLSGGIALSNISDYKICSLAYAAIITFVSFVLCIPRTFERISWISFVSVSSILIACVITIVASGLQSLETLQAATGKNLGPVHWYASEHHDLIDVVNALTNSKYEAKHCRTRLGTSDGRQGRDRG